MTYDRVYIYGFAADRERVHAEWLTVKLENSDKEIYGLERKLNIETGVYSWELRGLLKPVTHLLGERTRSNALALSTGSRENVSELTPPYGYTSGTITLVDMSRSVTGLLPQLLDIYEGDAALRRQVNSLLRDADTDIEDIAIKHGETISAYEFGERMAATQPYLYRAGLLNLQPVEFPSVVSFRRDNTGKAVQFDLISDESNGTQRLFALAIMLLFNLKYRTFTVVDELDASMHPLLTRKLLELFQSPDANPNGAQLLFTTHDPSLLDQELFRRDQIWLAEKCNGASEFYSLADVEPPPRNTESFLKNYITGRYGGVPSLGPAFDSLSVGTKP